MSERLIVFSADSHTSPTAEMWPDLIEKKYHHLLPRLHEDNERFTWFLDHFRDFSPEVLSYMDPEGVFQNDGHVGLWNAARRIQEMDREGIAAEIAFLGDGHVIPPFISAANSKYEPDVIQSAARGYNRWVQSEFGPYFDRLFVLAEPGACTNMPETLRELDWLGDHGFFGAACPGQTGDPNLPPLYDDYFEPFWAKCEEIGLIICIHAAYGTEQGTYLPEIERIYRRMVDEGRKDFLDEMINVGETFFRLNLKPRRAMWQLMLGGVLDRHPGLRFVLCEFRGDWLPETLKHLDQTFARNRDSLPAKRLPSEIFKTNFLAGLSFVHRAEIELRNDIGVENMTIGRDYPHPEGMWPNTALWLSDALHELTDEETRMILGENAVRVLGLDRGRLREIADRIGPRIEDIRQDYRKLDPRLRQQFDTRGGYLKAAEIVDHDAIDASLDIDLTRLVASA